MLSVIYVLFLDLLITSLSILFYLLLNLKKMRNLYRIFFLIATVLVMGNGLTSCSENEEDIAAPKIIINQPAENEIIGLDTNHEVNIDIEAKEEHGNLKDMIMYVSNESKYHVCDESKGNIKHPEFQFHDSFPLPGITQLTKLTLYVSFTNESGSFKEVYRVFYVQP
jgi:hypothetical protein